MARPTRNPRPARAEAPALQAFRSQLKQELLDARHGQFSREEIETHFSQMPMRYWVRVDAPTLRWHLGVLQDFFRSVITDETVGTAPAVRWRHFPDRGFTEVVIATWDRLGLLAKIAGAFAEAEINILRAEVYTRGDHAALDVFQVCLDNHTHVGDEARLVKVREILAALLSAHRDPALVKLAAAPTELRPPPAADGPVSIRLDTARSDDYTIVEIEAPDRLGLLYCVFRVLSAANVDVAQAIITTEDGRAGDVFYLTDEDGRKLADPERLAGLQADLARALA